MRTQSSDTSVEAELMHIKLLREAGPVRRARIMSSLTATTRRLSWGTLCRLHPEMTLHEKKVLFVRLLYGNELAEGLKQQLERQKEESPAVMNEEIIAAIGPVVEALEALGIPYLIGGSVASSVHGLPRSTNDADLVADLQADKIAELVNRLKDTYYLSENAIRTAVDQRTSFNLIYLDTMIKIDIFVLKDLPFDQTTFGRRVPTEVNSPSPRFFEMYTPEDILLQKLVWYEAGGRTSERQWLDILGILKMQGGNLDRPYLEEWAANVGLLELFNQAWAEAGF